MVIGAPSVRKKSLCLASMEMASSMRAQCLSRVVGENVCHGIQNACIRSEELREISTWGDTTTAEIQTTALNPGVMSRHDLGLQRNTVTFLAVQTTVLISLPSDPQFHSQVGSVA